MIRLVLDGQLQVETQLSDRVKYSSQVLTLCLAARFYNLTKFTCHIAMCKVYHQALSYVKELSETQVYTIDLIVVKIRKAQRKKIAY